MSNHKNQEVGYFFDPASHMFINYRLLLLKQILFLKFFGNNQQLCIPLLAEAFNEWFLQEFVCFHTLAATFDEGTAAYIPLMQIHTHHIANFAQAHGIEVARDGLAPGSAAFAIGLLNETDATAILIARCKDTVLAVND